MAHLPNIRYLTGFTGSSAVACLTRRDVVLVTDFRYRTQVEAEVDGAVRVEVASSDTWERLFKALGTLSGVKRVGVESDSVTVHAAERLHELKSGITLDPVRGLVERLRAVKHPTEVEAIRAAAALSAEAFEDALNTVRPGVTELEVAAALELALRRRGSEWHPFATIVASGPRSALPHAQTSRREIAAGDLLLVDFGAQLDGYCADITRTVVVGSGASERQRMMYELVEDAQRAAIRGIRPGMTGRDADRIARQVIETRGFGDAFGHSLGHGLGLEVHEAPRVSKANEEPLPLGCVITVEPGVYLPGVGGVRLEDDVYLGESGLELLSDNRVELREL